MDSGSSADWSRLDRALQKATDTFHLAAVEEDFQMVGLLCREAFISLAQTIYDGSRHQTVDGVVPSITDAKRILEKVVEHYKVQGEEPVLRLFESRDVRLAEGYRLAYYPGTRREVWAGYHAGRYEHLLMLRPLAAPAV